MSFVKKYDEETTTLLNAIKGSATDFYKSRVPDATQDNMDLVADAILNDDQTKNSFLQALVDRIAFTLIKSASFNNPLKEFKRGTKEYGKDIQEIFVDLVKAETYDPKQSYANVEKRAIPDVKTVFHTENRLDKYKTTITEADLQRAFTSNNGMSNLINKILNSLYVSDEVDEFELMKAIIRVAGKSGRLHSITIPAPTDEATTKSVMKTIKKASNDMMFPNLCQQFNFAGVVNPVSKDDQVVLISTGFDASVDVELLASAFNMEKTDFEQRKIVVDDFGGLENVECIVCSYRWLLAWDDYLATKRRENEDGLYTNVWLHHHETLSSSPFECAVAFITATPTVTAIDVLPSTATVEAGKSVQFNVEVTGTNNPSAKCTWEHDGTSEYTYINSLGFLVIGEDESTSPLTVTATSVVNDTITDTAVVTVV